MKTEILLHDECALLADRYGLGDLCAQARAMHAKAEAQTGVWTPMVILRAFLFQPATGDCAVLFAFAGTRSQETEGYEGVRVEFEPDELPEARAALVEASAAYDARFIADDLGERIRTAAGLPG